MIKNTPPDIYHDFEEVQLTYHNKTKAKDRPYIKSPQEAYAVLLQLWDKDQIDLVEECKILLLDNRLRLMSVASVSKGGTMGTVVDPRIIFATALKRRASSIIMAHNHPSGNTKPSNADIQLTQEFIQAGKFLQLPIQDHLIITNESFCSMVNDNHVLLEF